MSDSFEVRLDHVSVAVPDVAATVERLLEHRGVELGASGDAGAFRAAQLRVGDEGMTAEILGAGDSPGFVDRFLARNGPGPHHLAFRVPDLRAALRRAERAGFNPVDVVVDAEIQREFFLSPRETGGALIQVLSRSLSDEEYLAIVGPLGPWGGRRLGWLGPEPTVTLPAVRLEAVEVAQISEEQARRLFADALGGIVASVANHRIEFTWPGGAVHAVPGSGGIRSLLVSGAASAIQLPGARGVGGQPGNIWHKRRIPSRM